MEQGSTKKVTRVMTDYQFDSNPFVLYSWHIFQKEGLDTILNADMVPSKFSFAREKWCKGKIIDFHCLVIFPILGHSKSQEP